MLLAVRNLCSILTIDFVHEDELYVSCARSIIMVIFKWFISQESCRACTFARTRSRPGARGISAIGMVDKGTPLGKMWEFAPRLPLAVWKKFHEIICDLTLRNFQRFDLNCELIGLLKLGITTNALFWAVKKSAESLHPLLVTFKELQGVPRTTAFFQSHTALTKMIRFQKFLHCTQAKKKRAFCVNKKR